MKNSKISIIIPTYNRPDKLLTAVLSVINQTYQNYEIIIIDDGSIPKAEVFLKNNIEFDEKIRYFYQKNKGRSVARNIGIEKSKGEFISFLDDDDELLPDFLLSLILILQNNISLDLVFSNCYIINKAQKNLFRNFKNLKRENILSKFIRGNYIPNMCFIYRKERIKNIRFKEGKKYNEDYLFNMRIIKKNNITFYNKPLAIYNFHKDNTTNQNLIKMRMDEFETVKNFLDFDNLTEYKKKIIKSLRKKYKNLLITLNENRKYDILENIRKDKVKYKIIGKFNLFYYNNFYLQYLKYLRH